ncbi:MAG: hypothetical protein OXR66_05435 [Candidatus Woesearchaeota archaeon]|nr:hypothetical protein [Candidatus Woesearchaeota archaeon]
MSVFREALVFFDQIGLYDVVLPFLLVFTLVFGVLEKSKIFGTEKSADDKTRPRKNLNAMVAFITGFFVVASAQLVELINVLVARVALILVILICLMMLLASFHKQQDDHGFEIKGKAWLSAVVVIAVILIFLDGVGWLGFAWNYAISYWDSTFMGILLLLIIIIAFIMFITKDASGGKKNGNGTTEST